MRSADNYFKSMILIRNTKKNTNDAQIYLPKTFSNNVHPTKKGFTIISEILRWFSDPKNNILEAFILLLRAFMSFHFHVIFDYDSISVLFLASLPDLSHLAPLTITNVSKIKKYDHNKSIQNVITWLIDCEVISFPYLRLLVFEALGIVKRENHHVRLLEMAGENGKFTNSI